MKVTNLSKTIDQKEILRNIHFELTPGEIVGLVGRNGSGKTTLFRTLSNQYLADTGEVWIHGENIFEQPQYKTELFFIDEDEPFDGLDVLVKKQMVELLLDAISNEPISILVSSHQLNELEPIIDRVILLSQHTITQDYQLESLREKARKLQLVFKGKDIPELVKQNSKAIDIQGRVIVALFENYNDELAQQIKTLEPLVMEELPIQLSDVFEANLRNEKV